MVKIIGSHGSKYEGGCLNGMLYSVVLKLFERNIPEGGHPLILVICIKISNQCQGVVCLELTNYISFYDSLFCNSENT